LSFGPTDGEFREFGLYTLHSRPDEKSHKFEELLEAMPEHVRRDLLVAFAAWPKNEGKPFLEWCKPYNRLFMDSCYPFEYGAKLDGLKFDRLRLLLAFIKEFVHRYPIQEWVEFETGGKVGIQLYP
jgi:hypothetical protein